MLKFEEEFDCPKCGNSISNKEFVSAELNTLPGALEPIPEYLRVKCSSCSWCGKMQTLDNLEDL